MELEELRSEARTGARRVPIFIPYLALVLGVIGLGFSAIFVKWANAPGTVSGFYRMAIAAAVMAVPFAARARREQPAPGRYYLIAAFGGLFFAGDLALWNTAVLMSSATTSTFLGNTSPLWVALGALLLFKQKLGRLFWAGLLLTMIGASVMVGSDFLTHPLLGLGDLLAAAAGFCYGSFYLAAERARQKLSTMTAWWVSAAASTVVLLIASLLLRQPLLGYSATTYWNLVLLALVTQVGGYLAINYALGHLPASIVSPTMVGQPIVTAILAVALLAESLGAAQFFGGALVLIGILVVHRSSDSP
ncbi:MAG: DMT family transporter [Rudaea sp.]